MTTGELQKAAVTRGRGPLFGALVAVVAIALIGGVALALRGGLGGRGEDTSSGVASAGENDAGANAPVANAGGNGAAAHDGDAGSAGNEAVANDGEANAGEVNSGEPEDAGASGSDAPPPPGQGGLDAPPPPGLGGLDAPPPPGNGDSAPPDVEALIARIRVTGGSYIISNSSKVRWSGCTVTAPGQKVASLKPLPPGGSQELQARAFRKDASAESVSRALLIRCKQGTARVALP